MREKEFHLGFLANSPLRFDGNRYLYQTGEWRYIKRIANLFETVDICGNIMDISLNGNCEKNKFIQELRISNAIVHDITKNQQSNKSFIGWIRKKILAFFMLQRLSRDWDFAFIMAPSWLSVLFLIQNWRRHLPYAISFRGDWKERAEFRFPKNPVTRIVFPIYLHIIGWIESRLLYGATIRMSSGYVLSGRYPSIAKSIILSANLNLSTDEFRRRNDSSLHRPIRAIYVGSIVPRKGLNIAIQAVAQCISKGFDLEFHVVGDGSETSNLILLSRDLGIYESVVFHGFVNTQAKILDLLYQSDFFLLTSNAEGFPRVIYEAMSQSIPVIATRVGGVPIILENEITSLIIEPGDVPGVTDAIIRLISDKQLRDQLMINGYELALHIIRSDPVEQAVKLFQERLEDLAAAPA